jgi:hypothetical protein
VNGRRIVMEEPRYDRLVDRIAELEKVLQDLLDDWQPDGPPAYHYGLIAAALRKRP